MTCQIGVEAHRHPQFGDNAMLYPSPQEELFSSE
jgi:hypothetical protein